MSIENRIRRLGGPKEYAPSYLLLMVVTNNTTELVRPVSKVSPLVLLGNMVGQPYLWPCILSLSISFQRQGSDPYRLENDVVDIQDKAAPAMENGLLQTSTGYCCTMHVNRTC